MSKFYIDNNGLFYYGDKPDDIEAREATTQEVYNHHLLNAKKSKLSEAFTKNITRQISDERRADLETQIDNAATVEEVENIII